jgi:hypothetical protein
MRSRWTGPEALAPLGNCRMRLGTQASATMTVFSATASIPVLVVPPTPCAGAMQHTGLHDDGSASGTHSLESAHHGTAVKGASVQC